MTMGSTDEVDRIQAVEKTLNVLEALWQLGGAGVTELTNQTGLAKSTVHAHLKTLRSKGYVVQGGDEYRLSLRFLSFGEHVKHEQPLYSSAASSITNLAERTGERVLCVTEQNGLGPVVRAAGGARSVSTGIGVGTHTYLHCSAGGKAMLAHFSQPKVDWVIDEWGLPRFTESTITERDDLVSELESVREDGIAYNRGEYLPGVGAVGTPITGTDGDVLGAVTITGPERRLETEWEFEELHGQLRAAVNAIEVDLLFAADSV